MHHIVERRLGRAVLQSLLEAAEIVAVRLLLIESIHRCVDCTVSRAPVRHDEARGAPGSPRDGVQQVRIFAGSCAVHQVIGAHHELDRANFSTFGSAKWTVG
jgi:hypothetical protein